MEGGKKTRGLQRIPMRKIKNQDDRFAAFSKRRKGFYKKASELCWVSGSHVGIVLTSPVGRMFSFFNPSLESIIQRFFTGPRLHLGGEIALAVDAQYWQRVNELNGLIDRVEARMEVLNQKWKALGQSNSSSCRRRRVAI